MNNKVETKLKTEKPKTEKPKIRFQVNAGGSSIIYRNDGLPFIIDKTNNAIKWIADKGYKEKEIEIIGEKPAEWDAIFSPPPPVIAPEPIVAPAEPVTPTESVVEILS
jgi:hypothetical protein